MGVEQHESKIYEISKCGKTTEHTHTHTARGTRGNDVAGQAIFAKLANSASAFRCWRRRQELRQLKTHIFLTTDEFTDEK